MKTLSKPKNQIAFALLTRAGGSGSHRKPNKAKRLAGKRELAKAFD